MVFCNFDYQWFRGIDASCSKPDRVETLAMTELTAEQHPAKDTTSPWLADAVLRAKSIDEAGKSPLGPMLTRLYRWPRLRSLVIRLCQRLEGHLMFSQTMRDILLRYHEVEVGAYSYGDVLRPNVLPPGTRVGRYCSVGKELIVRRRDHPLHRTSTHPAFYDHRIGLLKADTIPSNLENPLTIGNDVWIGDRVLILSGCKSIGNGAVLAAGSVVTRDVPAYTVVGGVPARVIRMRFNQDRIDKLEESNWWEKSLSEIIEKPVI